MKKEMSVPSANRLSSHLSDFAPAYVCLRRLPRLPSGHADRWGAPRPTYASLEQEMGLLRPPLTLGSQHPRAVPRRAPAAPHLRPCPRTVGSPIWQEEGMAAPIASWMAVVLNSLPHPIVPPSPLQAGVQGKTRWWQQLKT
jgi:hypothetical protein